MAVSTLAFRARHSIFILSGCTSLVAAAYLQLFSPYRPSWITPQDVLEGNRALWPLLAAIPLLFVAGLVVFVSPRIATALSLVASSLALIYSTLMLCAFATLAFVPLFFASGFITFGLPTILAFLVLVYSLHLLRARMHPYDPFRWVIAREGAHYAIKGILVVAVVAASLFLGLELLLHRTFQETHRMTWEEASNARCAHEVTLYFEDAPPYSIRTCSPELGASLAATSTGTVEVVFLVTYTLGSWTYQVETVGEWSGVAEFSGLALRCGSDEDDCSRYSGGPPFRQPYILR